MILITILCVKPLVGGCVSFQYTCMYFFTLGVSLFAASVVYPLLILLLLYKLVYVCLCVGVSFAMCVKTQELVIKLLCLYEISFESLARWCVVFYAKRFMLNLLCNIVTRDV